MKPQLQVAIDGPAGAGKSTIAKLLAQKLGLIYVDTGSMYRALTVKVIKAGYDPNNQVAIAALAQQVEIKLVPTDQGDCKVLLDGEDVTKEIRQPAIARNVSLVARIPDVRESMLRRQQSMVAQQGVVMDGRDIGTRVLPNAPVKFFLTASVAERAKRRQLDFARQGNPVDLDILKAEIAERDHIDQTREIDPLKPATEAIIIDATDLTIEQVIDLMCDRINKVYR